MSEEHQENDESCLNAARQRADEITAETDSCSLKPENFAEFFRLGRELDKMALILGIITAADAEESARVRDEQEKSCIESARRSRELTRERTPVERVMMSLSERLETRQGTFIPDFDALYKKKANLDRKLSDP
jgi:hypothetical protein